MTLEQNLRDVGLNKNEIRVYWYLLAQGLATPPQVARGTKIARTHCYNLLRSLQDKQLIREQKMGSRKAYIPLHPKALVSALERKKEALEDVLPALEAFYTTQVNKPTISFYEGLTQVQEIYFQTLSANEIFSIGSTKHLSERDSDFFSKYVKLVKQKQIVVHDIISATSGAEVFSQTKEVLKGYYEAKILPPNYSEFKTDVLIWNDNVALITLEEPIFGTVLKNKLLAQTFKIIFTVMKEGIH